VFDMVVEACALMRTNAGGLSKYAESIPRSLLSRLIKAH